MRFTGGAPRLPVLVASRPGRAHGDSVNRYLVGTGRSPE